MSFCDKVYEVVKTVPKGKVITYKQIAEILDTKAHRAVGTCMKKNNNRDCDSDRSLEDSVSDKRKKTEKIDMSKERRETVESQGDGESNQNSLIPILQSESRIPNESGEANQNSQTSPTQESGDSDKREEIGETVESQEKSESNQNSQSTPNSNPSSESHSLSNRGQEIGDANQNSQSSQSSNPSSESQSPVVPCFRVVCSNGEIGEFNKGVERKIELLRSEGIEIEIDGKNPQNSKIKNFEDVKFR